MVDIFGPLLSRTSGQSNIFNAVRDVSTNQLNAQLQNDFQARVDRETAKIESSFANELNGVQNEQDRVTSFRKDLRESLDSITNNKTRLEGVLTRIDNLIINVNKATNAEADPDNTFLAAGYAAAHDSIFRQLDDLISNSRVRDNLLDSNSSSITYPISLSGATTRIEGNDLTTRYSIEDQEGDNWHPLYDTQLLKTFESYPFGEGNKVVSTIHDQGITLNSFDGTNVDFTIGADTASPQNYTGTVSRSGLEILNAWLYDGLETAEGRERAIEDLNAAKEAAKLEISRFELVETTVSYYDEILTTQLSGLREELVSVQREAANAIGNKQNQLIQQFQASQSALSQQLALRSNYQNLLGSLTNDPLTIRLLDAVI